MKLIRWLIKVALYLVVILGIVVLFTYASITLPFSPRYIDWENPEPIYDSHRPLYVVDNVLVRERDENKIEFVALEDMPQFLIDAFVAIEDNRFFEHRGYDVRGILRAVKVNIRSGDFVQGGSTITQQLARNLFLNHDQTAERKLLELCIAVELERRFSKEEIFEMYLNQIYFGSGNYGVERAAQGFFGKSATELDLGEAAMLAGIIKAPSVYNPRANHDLALKHQQIVLGQMMDSGFISEEEWVAFGEE